MNVVNNEGSITANIEIQVIQNVRISRYFTAAGLVIALYDTILTTEDEVSGILTQTLELRSFFEGPAGVATAFRSSEAALLYQPVLDDCVLDRWQLSCVQALKKPFEALTLIMQDMAGFQPPFSTAVCPPSHLQLSNVTLTYTPSRPLVISVPSSRR